MSASKTTLYIINENDSNNTDIPGNLASYADALWACHAIFLPPRTSAEAKETFLSLCSKISAGRHVEITKEPIGARLLFNRKPIISCDRTITQEGD